MLVSTLINTLLLSLIQFHLDIEHWLLHSLLLFTRDFEIETPVEICHFACSGELVLNVCLCQWGTSPHLFEEKLFQLFLHCLWQLFS